MNQKLRIISLLLIFLFSVILPSANSLPTVSNSGEVKEFTILSQSVYVEINNNLVQTNIVQSIKNNSKKPGDLALSIAIPHGAHANSFSAIVNGKLYRGAVIDKDKAYDYFKETKDGKLVGIAAEEAKKIMREGDVIEEEGVIEEEIFERDVTKSGTYVTTHNNSISVNLHGIAAFSDVIFQVSYIEQAKYEDGRFKYYFGSVKNDEELSTLKHFDFSISFKCSAEIREVTSESHTLDGWVGGEEAAFSVSDIGVVSGDFKLAWTLNLLPGVPYLLNREIKGEDPYFSMLFLPPDVPVMTEGKSVILLFDKSGSMGGERYKLAVESLKKFVGKLKDVDIVNLVMFDTEEYYCAPFPFKANAEGKKAVLDYIDTFSAGGGTRFLAPLLTGMETLSFAPGNLPSVVLLSDGADNRDRAKAFHDAVKAKTGFSIPIYTFAIGWGCDEPLLRCLSFYSGAEIAYVRKESDIIPGMERIAEAFENVVAANFKVESDAGDVYDFLPAFRARLYKDELTTVFGRRKSGVSKATISATTSLGKWSVVADFTDVNTTETCSFLHQLWASGKMKELLDREDIFGKSEDLKQEIIALSVKYLITSPYTVFIFICDDDPLKGIIALGYGSGSPTGAYGHRKGGSRKRRAKRKTYPLISDTLQICDKSGKPLPNQELGHAFLLALAGDNVKEKHAKFRLMSSQAVQKMLYEGKLSTDFMTIAATAYGLTQLPADKNIWCKPDDIVNVLVKMDPLASSKENDDECVAMAAYFVSELKKQGHKLPDGFMKSVKTLLLNCMKVDFSKNPIGCEFNYAMRWVEWFPIILLIGESYDIRFTELKLHEHLTDLAFNNSQRNKFSNPELFYVMMLKKLINSDGTLSETQKEKVKGVIGRESLYLNSRITEDKSIIWDTLKDRTTEIIGF